MGAIHNKIKKLREQSGLTQQEMADKLNMHLKSWQKVENGITKLDIERLQLIADVLETTIEDLINVDDSVYINAIKDNVRLFDISSIRKTNMLSYQLIHKLFLPFKYYSFIKFCNITKILINC